MRACRTITRRTFLKATAAGALAAGGLACGNKRDATIGSKNFQEQWILAALIAELINRRDKKAVTKDLSGTFLCHKGIVSGSLDAYVEYTGTAFTAVLEREPITDTEKVYEDVKAAYAEKFDILVLPPLGFENTYAILVRPEDAERHSLAKISDLTRIQSDLTFGIGFEFYDRADGYPGLLKTYGLSPGNAPRQMELGLIYRALESKQVDVIAGNSTDGMIAAMGLVMLEDDRRYFPPYDAVPLLRRASATKTPALRAVLEALGNKISAEAMRNANFLVDGEKRSPKTAARHLIDTLELG